MKSSPPWLRQLEERWQAAQPRERQMTRMAAGAIAVALLWLIAISPAWTTLAKAPIEIDRLDSELRQMRALAQQAQQLKDALPVPQEQSITALRSATERLGPNAELTLTGPQAQLRLRGITGAALATWLTEARQSARARPQEVELQSGPQGYSGRLTVVLPSASGT
ncbi:general secretion pathway protein M [Roseateles sp. YR242]|uniref:type II secretion system protein GspM n=1 Tax=Roseateles sp. YR242 TaxID=1855305 RepID=UPI0008B3D92F|nr:type II secretion system protein GspM [Roseateles sp. YR242]SEL74390.1 general secretion pathway protein M [Roseateles sp. YR242]